VLIEEDREQHLAGSYIIKSHAHDWEESQIALHYVTPQYCAVAGQPAREVWDHFWPLLQSSDTVVAFNLQFHWHMIERLGFAATGAVPLPPENTRYMCAMRLATDIVRVPGRHQGRYVSPKLSETFRYFSGASLQKGMSPRGNGMDNCNAVRAIWHGIEDHKSTQGSMRKYG